MPPARSAAALLLVGFIASAAGSQVVRTPTAELLLPPGEEVALFGTNLAVGDLDGDGFDELIVTAPAAASVLIYRGSSLGLLFWNDLPAPDLSDVGSPLAVGDFDDDGRDEFVFGSPTFSDEATHAGNATYVDLLEILGSSTFVTSTLASASPAASDLFGAVLAAGDFDNDGHDDLAAGVPFADVLEGPIRGPTTVEDAGKVEIYYGTSSGLPSLPDLSFDVQAIGDLLQDDEYLGTALAADDLDGDGYEDLAVGAPGFLATGGRVLVHRGTPSGLSVNPAQGGFFPLEILPDEELLDTPFLDGGFGTTLAIGDFDLSLACLPFDCRPDLAVGSPGNSLAGIAGTSHGSVVIYPGSSALVSVDDGYRIDQRDAPGSDPEDGDRFGWSLRAGRFDDDSGPWDLAVGTEFEDDDRGIVQFFYGSSVGLTSASALEHATGPAAPRLAGDRFGADITSGRFTDSGFLDVAIGVPGRPDGATSLVGAVEILYGCLFCDGFESGDASRWE